MKITIKNWKHYQHYNKRRPPWIKMYRDLLDDRSYRALDDSSARLLIDLWLLASEGKDEPGTLVIAIEELAWRLRDASKVLADYERMLDAIENQGFISRASNMLATCYQHATPETETETEADPLCRKVSSSRGVDLETGEIKNLDDKYFGGEGELDEPF